MLSERDIAMETDHVIKAYLSAIFAFKISQKCIKPHQKLKKNVFFYHFCV